MRKLASRDTFSFCWTVWHWSLFLAHPTYWHERVTSDYAQESIRCWFWPSLWQNQSLETILFCIVVLYFPHDTIFWMYMCDECRLSNELSVCQRFLFILRLLLQNLFISHRISGSPVRAKYKHLRTICDQTFVNSPTDPSSSSLN